MPEPYILATASGDNAERKMSETNDERKNNGQIIISVRKVTNSNCKTTKHKLTVQCSPIYDIFQIEPCHLFQVQLLKWLPRQDDMANRDSDCKLFRTALPIHHERMRAVVLLAWECLFAVVVPGVVLNLLRIVITSSNHANQTLDVHPPCEATFAIPTAPTKRPHPLMRLQL